MKLRRIIFLALLLSACLPVTPTPMEEATEESATTEEAVATEERTVTEEPAATEALTEPPLRCVELLAPLNLADLPALGKVTFEWSALEGADSYLLIFTLSSGESVAFETDGTTRERYMEAFPQGGAYQWNVAALDAEGETLCDSDFFTFAKPVSVTVPENVPQAGDGEAQEKNDGNNDGGPIDGGDGGDGQ